MPRTNTTYWNAKLGRNVERDAENEAKLKSMGWNVLTIWECQTRDHKLLEKDLDSSLGWARAKTL